MATPKKKSAATRKRIDNPKRIYKPMGGLHVLLAQSFPTKRTADYDVFDVKWLARQLEMTEEGIYSYLRQNSLPFKRAEEIVELAGCKKKLADFLPFVSR